MPCAGNMAAEKKTDYAEHSEEETTNTRLLYWLCRKLDNINLYPILFIRLNMNNKNGLFFIFGIPFGDNAEQIKITDWLNEKCFYTVYNKT